MMEVRSVLQQSFLACLPVFMFWNSHLEQLRLCGFCTSLCEVSSCVVFMPWNPLLFAFIFGLHMTLKERLEMRALMMYKTQKAYVYL